MSGVSIGDFAPILSFMANLHGFFHHYIASVVYNCEGVHGPWGFFGSHHQPYLLVEWVISLSLYRSDTWGTYQFPYCYYNTGLVLLET